MRAAIIVVGAIAAVLGIIVKSVYALFYLCGDLVFVILFPQLFSVVHLQFTNEIGCWAGYILGMLLRLTGGETILGFPPLIKYPWFDEVSGKQLFPFKTLCMVVCLTTTIVVSLIVNCWRKKEKGNEKDNLGMVPTKAACDNAGY